MNLTPRIPPYRDSGYRLKADEDWNAILSAIRTLNLGSMVANKEPITTYFCAVTSTGPNAATDFTDARYWVKRQYLDNTDSDYTASISTHAALYDSTTSNYWLCATNLYELTKGSHNVDTSGDELVQIFRTLDVSASQPTFHYYFWKEIGGFWGRLTDELSDGYYSWEKLKADAETMASDFGVVSGVNNAKEVNAIEGIYTNVSEGTVVWLRHDWISDPDEYRFAYEVGNEFWGKIVGNNQDSINYRWIYNFNEVEKTGAGYGGWANKSGGIASSAYNSIEDMNGSTGMLGVGVLVSDLDTADFTFELQPCPSGAIVRMYPVYLAGSDLEYWFSYENGVTGSCVSN